MSVGFMRTGRRRATLLGVVFLVLGCAQAPSPTPPPRATPLPVVGSTSNGGMRAAGKVVPIQQAELGLPNAGRVQRLAVALGEQVAAEALLLALEDAGAQATLAQAQASLDRAQAHLAEVQTSAPAQAIAAAQARLEALQAHLAQLEEAARPSVVAAAQAAVAAAQAALDQLSNPPPVAEQVAAQAAISNTLVALRQAQENYDKVAWRFDVGLLPESQQLEQATYNLAVAQAHSAALYAAPTADVLAAARAQVQQAQAELDLLLHPATASQLSEAAAQVRAAQAELDLLRAEPQAEVIAMATAELAAAQATLQGAQANLELTVLRAPFTGTVSALKVHLGELVMPGQPLLTLADLSHLQVETSDLSERDVVGVKVGQAASVFVQPLAVEIPGHVMQIAPQANVVGGDVVYTVVVKLDEPAPPTMRWGMSVEVEILVDP
jgi:multidrug efflux pump subunit AcrA (membrane-fusion protein)